jgi:hypothetical protein
MPAFKKAIEEARVAVAGTMDSIDKIAEVETGLQERHPCMLATPWLEDRR